VYTHIYTPTYATTSINKHGAFGDSKVSSNAINTYTRLYVEICVNTPTYATTSIKKHGAIEDTKASSNAGLLGGRHLGAGKAMWYVSLLKKDVVVNNRNVLAY